MRTVGFTRMTAEERFWSKVDKSPHPKGCWMWTASKVNGYGRFMLGYGQVAATRWLYEHLHGKLPREILIRHKCDNPSCVNPDHLEPGTPTENSRDMISRGRCNARNKTHCQKGHPFDHENTLWTRQGTRLCYICSRATAGRSYRRRKEVQDNAHEPIMIKCGEIMGIRNVALGRGCWCGFDDDGKLQRVGNPITDANDAYRLCAVLFEKHGKTCAIDLLEDGLWMVCFHPYEDGMEVKGKDLPLAITLAALRAMGKGEEK